MFYKIGLISLVLSVCLNAEINSNKEYKVTELYGESTKSENLTIKINDNASFSAFDGCNRIMGTYSTENENLKINENMISTRKFCQDAIYADGLNESLSKIRTYNINENKIEFFDEDKKKILELVESK